MKYSENYWLHCIDIIVLAAVCPTGFTGTYCDDQCKYPNYGYGCQQQCLCPKMRCNFVNGCSKRKPSEILKENILKLTL